MRYSTYPEYNSFRSFKNRPAHWSEQRTDSCSKLCRFSISDDNLNGRQVFYYSIPVVQERGTGEIEYGDFIESSKQVITERTLLVSKLNPRKSTIVLADPYPGLLTVCSGEFVPLLPINCHAQYLEYVFRSEEVRQYLDSRVESVTRSHQRANPDDILKMWWVWPPLTEQKAIAAFLDRETERIDSLIEKKKRQIDLLQRKRAALISQAVTKGLNPNAKMKDSGVEWLGEIPAHWNCKQIRWIASVKARLGWKGLTASEYVDEGFIFLSTPNIKSREIDWTNVNYITSERYYESPEIMLQEGDVLLVKDGSTLGICNVIRKLPSAATVNSSIAVLRNIDGIYPNFLYYFLSSDFIQKLIQLLKGGMGVPHLFQWDIQRFPLALPPLEEQKQIADYLDIATLNLEETFQKIDSSITKLQQYRTALISAAVTGKIDVRKEVAA